MEKETVIEIEFMPVWDNKWVWRIKKNKIIGGKIEDNEIETSIYIDSNNFANIDLNKEDSYLINTNCLINKAMKDRLEYIVEKVNEKYGVNKRWRAENEGCYYYIHSDYSLTVFAIDHRFTDDNNRYEAGNYFSTGKEAKEYKEYMKQKSLEWHEKRLENDKS